MCVFIVIGELYGSVSYIVVGFVVEIGSGYMVGDVFVVLFRIKCIVIVGLIIGFNYLVGNYKSGDVCKYINLVVIGYKEVVCIVVGNGLGVIWKNLGVLV